MYTRTELLLFACPLTLGILAMHTDLPLVLLGLGLIVLGQRRGSGPLFLAGTGFALCGELFGVFLALLLWGLAGALALRDTLARRRSAPLLPEHLTEDA